MKAILVLMAGLMGTYAQAGVESVLSMQRDANGAFTVLCETPGAEATALSSGVTAESIRADKVCAAEQPQPPAATAILEEGTYATDSQFCSQNIAWQGDKLQVTVNAPCSGTLLMEKFDQGWYRGQLQGYEYVYELEVRSPTAYVFHSRSFAKSGEFTKQTGQPQPVPAVKPWRTGDDPTGI